MTLFIHHNVSRGARGGRKILCPKTGAAIYTGLDLDDAIFEWAVIENNSVWCPDCKEYHRYSKEDLVK